MVKFNLEVILTLTGNLKDDTESQKKFRTLLKEEKLTLDDYSNWIEECLSNKESNYNRALQDIINSIGEKLGFDVQYGVYQGKSGALNCDGVWSYPDKQIKLVIETKKSSSYTIKLQQITKYIDQIESQNNENGNVYGLFIVGDEDIDTLISTIRGSDYRSKLRVLTVKSLLLLLQLKYSASLRDNQIVKLLMPLDAINIGEIIQLIDDIVETRIREDKIENPTEIEISNDLDIPMISRKELQSLPEGEVAICPSKPDGISFLIKHNAWGFVRIAKKPKYFALYVSSPESSIQYFGIIEEILDPKDPNSPVAETAEKYETYEREGKKIIKLKPDSLWKLKEDIKLGENRNQAIQSLTYFDLEIFKKAKTIDDFKFS